LCCGGQGRVRQIRTGTETEPTQRQDLQYTYDPAGNVLTIVDNKVLGGAQTQRFGYDPLDRLVSASADRTVDQGQYTESYAYNAIGNLISKGGVSYGYNDLAHKHAVTHLGVVQKYWYDANGNQTKRIVGSDTYDQIWDNENRLTQVKKNGSVVATFVYDGNGNRVKATVNGTTTIYVGNYYEKTGSAIRKYYYFAGQRVAMRDGSTVYYLVTDHLSSTSKTLTSSGGVFAELRYKPYGEIRYTSGTTPTNYRYTGQLHDSYINLYIMGARWYDPALGDR
jgi:YD repeat-containing protein